MGSRRALLAPYVDSLVAYDSDRGEPGVHVGLPSTSLTLVVALDAPLDIGWLDAGWSDAGGADGSDRPRAVRLWASVSGLHTAPAQIRHDGSMRGVQVGLRPAGMRALLGVPAGALAGRIVEVDDVDPGLADLPERLADHTDGPPRRWAELVADALVDRLARHDTAPERPELGRALALLTRGEPVARVAREVGFSRRHLGEVVRSGCGLGPKDVQRVARLQRAQRLARHARDRWPGWAAIAAEAGYADQSHLSREWSALAGCTPGEWARRELPFVQDDPAEAPAQWTHERIQRPNRAERPVDQRRQR